MNLEQIKKLGVTEDIAKKVEEESKKELESYVPKSEFEALQGEKTTLETQLTERNGQLEELKKENPDVEGLKEKIEQLQKDNEEKDQAHKKEIAELRMNGAIKDALSGKVHDVEIVAGLIDREKIALDKDGAVYSGLNEQIKDLSESKPFLFVQEGQDKAQGDVKKAENGRFHFGNTNEDTGNKNEGDQTVSLKDAIAERMNLK